MRSQNRFFTAAALAAVLLAGCGQTSADETAAAVESAREAFEMNAAKPTEELPDAGFHKPAGWKAVVHPNEHQAVLTKGRRTLTFTYDPNAKADSRSSYELIKGEAGQGVLTEETFTDAGTFGFITIRKQGEELAEITAGTGQAQVKTIVGQHDMEAAAGQMMEIARSVEITR